MRTHILRPDSITPIALYLERRDAEPGKYGRQLDLAAALVYREHEYRGMYYSSWLKGERPAPSSESPFVPYDVTPEAAAILASHVGVAEATDRVTVPVPQPDDLFGLKGAVTDSLLPTLRPVASHRIGWLTAGRLLADLCRFREAIDVAEVAVKIGEPLPGLALISHAALLGTLGPNPIPDGERISRESGSRARRMRPTRPPARHWPHRTLDVLDERLRNLGIRTRLRIEGQSFGRFLMSDREFCEQARTQALEGFAIDRVPAALRDLADLARAIGVGDDPCRTELVRRMGARERSRAVERIEAHEPHITEWLNRLGDPPYPVEASAYFWLLEAAEEIRVGLHKR